MSSGDANERASANARSLGIEPGDILAEKYEVERVLGSGGMGVVVAARHIHLDERVAIKFLRPQALSNAEAVARFNQEARVAVKIKSEHVARVLDVGQLASGAPYLVMEHLDGMDLAAWLKKKGPLEVGQAVEFVIHACEALAEAHAAGIVHRDLKPANLFAVRQADGLLAVKVLDFGISKLSAMGSMNPSMTNTAAVLGSPHYMSPEQMQSSKTVDPRTDIWSLGIILYELLAGHVPFQAESMPELILAIVREPFVPLRQVAKKIPWTIDRVVARALEKDRAVRFQTVADLAVALREFVPPHALPILERTVRIVEASGATVTALAPSSEDFDGTDRTERNPAMTGTMSSWGQTGSEVRAENRRRRVKRAVWMGAAGAVLTVGLGALGWRYSAAHRGPLALHPTSAPRLAAPPASSAASGAGPGSILASLDAGVAVADGAGASDGTDHAAGASTNGIAIAPVTSAGSSSASSSALTASPAGSASAGTKRGSPPLGPRRHPGASPPVAHSAAPPPAPSCTPPFVIDGDGHKQYKPECI